jgi:sugar lactone lactonase YvrE
MMPTMTTKTSKDSETRFTVVRQATFALAFTVAAGCGYDSSYSMAPPAPDPAVEDGLWTVSASAPAVLHLAPTQLLTDGDRTPVASISTSSATLSELNGMAFDADGTMWVTSQHDSTLVAFGPASLAHSGSADATSLISSASLGAPTGLAFDKQHRLWVANLDHGTIVRFDPAQLASSGSPVPSVIIAGFGQPAALAFDAAGSLWVSDIRRNKIASFSEAQLSASGFVAPQVVISTLGTSLRNPAGIAFDPDGNLWVANASNQTVVAFTPAQLATTGSPAPDIVLSTNASLGNPVGLAFDADGALWVVGDADAVEKFPKSSLGTTGAPGPSVRLTLANYTLFWNVAFWPKPSGLPLN